jgi:hypothetical protein
MIAPVVALLLSSRGSIAIKPIHHALLIGVSNYKKAGTNSEGNHLWDDLSGAKDVEILSKALVDCGVFKQNEILPIKNFVKRSEMVAAFRKWIAKPGGRPAQKGDVLFVHFSGHGYRFPALKGTPAYKIGYGSGLVFSDSKGDDPSGLLTNQELASLIRSVGSEASLTITIDACNSGDVTRARGIAKVRGRQSPLLKARTSTTATKPTETETGPFFSTMTSTCEALSACRSDQEASDVGVGVFTWSLVEALRDVARASNHGDKHSVTYGEFYDKIREHMLEKGGEANAQTPVIFGNHDRRLFGDEILQVPQHFVTTFDGTHLRIEAGSIFGVRKNQSFFLYRPGSSPSNGGKRVAVLSVADTDDSLSYNVAYLKVPKGVNPKSLQGCWAFAKADGVDPGALAIHFDGVPGNEKGALLASIRNQAAAIHETSKEHAELFVSATAQPRSGLDLMTRYGADLGKFKDDAAGRADLADSVRHFQQWRGLMDLTTPTESTCPNIEMEIVPVATEEIGGHYYFKSVLPKTTVFGPRDHFAIKVRATHPKSLNGPSLAILELTPDHKVYQLWPTRDLGQDGSRIPIGADGDWYWLQKGNEFTPVKGADKKTIFVPFFAPTVSDLDVKDGKPNGTADGVGGVVFKLFATEDPVDYGPLLSPEEPKDIVSPLASLINDFSKGRRGPPEVIPAQYRIVKKVVETRRRK